MATLQSSYAHDMFPRKAFDVAIDGEHDLTSVPEPEIQRDHSSIYKLKPYQNYANSDSTLGKLLSLRHGFLKSVQLVLRMREGSLMTAGPPCGSFIFLNMGTSGRRRDNMFFGNPLKYVKQANLTLSSCFYFDLLFCQHLFVCLLFCLSCKHYFVLYL